MKFLRVGFILVSYGAGVAVLLFAWQMRESHSRLQRECVEIARRSGLADAPTPPVYHGLELPILEHVEVRHTYRPDDAGADWQLILVYNEHCAACEQQMPIWERLFSDPQFKGVEPWFVESGAPGSPPQRLQMILEERRIPYRLMRVKATLPFMVATGFVAVPMTVLVKSKPDGLSRAELIQTGVGNDAVMGQILNSISIRRGKTTGTYFGLGEKEALISSQSTANQAN